MRHKPKSPRKDRRQGPSAERSARKQGKPKRGAKTDERTARGRTNSRDEPRKDTRHALTIDSRQGQIHQARGRARRLGEEAAHARAKVPLASAPRGPDRLQAAGELMRSKEPLVAGEWLWTMREGAERDLVEEMLLGNDLRPRGFLPALVVSRRAPEALGERLELTFARQGFPVSAVACEANLDALAEKLQPVLCDKIAGATEHGLHVFVPDSTDGNRLAQRAQSLGDLLTSRMRTAVPANRRLSEGELRHSNAPLAQVCLFAPDTAAAGVIASDRALSLVAGGRTRMRVAGASPSRAARKLEEAFAWLGISPEPGELCVDLGAAPGGWSWALLERRARVIAVDPARMDEKLATDRRLRHVRGDAFKFTPDEPVDWLFCDMVWRPIEVAQMLGRWARQRQTRMLVANFKLPMKRKVEQVEQLRNTLAAAGFTQIRTRQLYHDRDEITLSALVR